MPKKITDAEQELIEKNYFFKKNKKINGVNYKVSDKFDQLYYGLGLAEKLISDGVIGVMPDRPKPSPAAPKPNGTKTTITVAGTIVGSGIPSKEDLMDEVRKMHKDAGIELDEEEIEVMVNSTLKIIKDRFGGKSSVAEKNEKIGKFLKDVWQTDGDVIVPKGMSMVCNDGKIYANSATFILEDSEKGQVIITISMPE